MTLCANDVCFNGLTNDYDIYILSFGQDEDGMAITFSASVFFFDGNREEEGFREEEGEEEEAMGGGSGGGGCLLYTSPRPLDRHRSRMPSSA